MISKLKLFFSKKCASLVLRCALLLCSVGIVCSFVACKEEEKEIRFIGIKDIISIQASVNDYDFTKDVFCFDEEENSVEYKVDSSKVVFGKVGEYKIFYQSGKTKEEAIVRVYDSPTFTIDNEIKVTFVQAMKQEGVLEQIECKDSFGQTLQVTIEEFEKFNGVVASGINFLTISAEDLAGNTAEKEIEVMVETPTVQVTPIENQTVDYSYATLTLKVENYNLNCLYFDNKAVPEKYYLFEGGNLLFLPDFFVFTGVGEEKAVTIVYDECYIEFKLSITNKEEVNYQVENDFDDFVAFFQGESLTVPSIKVNEYSLQEVEVISFVKEANGERKMLFSDELKLSEMENTYCLQIEIYKDGELVEVLERIFYSSTDKAIKQIDFASTAAASYYSIYDKADGDGKITFNQNITKGGVTKNCVEFHTTSNLGVNMDDNIVGDYYHMANVSLKQEVIDAAGASGYESITFSLASGNTPAVNSASVANRVFVYDYKGSGSVSGAEGKYLYRTLGADSKWTTYTIALSEFSKGTIAFACGGDTLYIAEITFNKPIDLTADLSTVQNVWNCYDGTITFGEVVTKGETTKTALKFYTQTNLGMNTNDNIAGDYYHLSNISLKSNVIAEAVKAGYTSITVTMSSGNTPLVDSGNVANRIFVHDYKGMSTVNGGEGYLYRGLGADTKWQTYTIELSALSKGTIAFACGGDTLYIADVYFVK